MGQARALGLEVANTQVLRWGSQTALVVERFDRANSGWIHQEDLCQATGRLPTAKYERNGGPGAAEIATLLRRVCTDGEADIGRFVDALILTWLSGNTDAHAKNYSLVLAPGGQVRLAPLYDMTSALDTAPRSELHLSMAIGGETRLDRIGAPHWQALGREIGLDPKAVTRRVDALSARFRTANLRRPQATPDIQPERQREHTC